MYVGSLSGHSKGVQRQGRVREGCPEEGRYQLDLTVRVLDAWCVPTNGQVGTAGNLRRCPSGSHGMVNSLPSGLGWPATTAALGLGAATPHLAF